MRYLLDSSLLIDHANGDESAVALLRQLFEEGHDLYSCDVVTCEVLSRGEPDHLRHVEVLLRALEYVSTAPEAARWAGASRRARRATGGKRSLGDALIGGVAISLGATVVTRNRPDFERQGVPVLTY
ncbi:MAG: type II toxin-antitoxin system VapC family toxin [Chloroflexi bacterium]|nr:type II toxin-antitoxin system VapC family toxin [Chloroflexota bacterium]